MTLSELIAHVGNEHVQVQRIDQSFTAMDTNAAGETSITFQTTAVHAIEFHAGMPPPKMHGLVVWLPRERMPK